MPAGKPKRIFTSEEVSKIISLRQSGTSIADISKELHCNMGKVTPILKENGIEVSKKQSGRKCKDMPLTTRLNKYHKVGEFISMYQNGTEYTIEDIANHFHTTLEQVNRMADLLNLERYNLPTIKEAKKMDRKPSFKVNVRRFDNYNFLPKSLMGGTMDAANKLAEQIFEACTKTNHLKYYLNSISKDIVAGGKIGNTKFDILLPTEKTIIVNLDDESKKKEWLSNSGMNGFEFTDFIRKYGYQNVLFTYEGLDNILYRLDEYRGYRVNQSIIKRSFYMKPVFKN